MTVQTATIKTLTGLLAVSVAHAVHWRRRAQSVSTAELEQYQRTHMERLLTNPDPESMGMVCTYAVPHEKPPTPDRRWAWWIALTCPACNFVHEPLSGWSPSRDSAHETLEEAREWLMDPDNCPEAPASDDAEAPS